VTVWWQLLRWTEWLELIEEVATWCWRIHC
jgi:hypothetical protein